MLGRGDVAGPAPRSFTSLQHDWQLLTYASGRRRVTPGWLWEQHNEHWIPVVKLVHVALLRAFSYDYRGPIMANVVVLSLLSLVPIVVTTRRQPAVTRRHPAAGHVPASAGAAVGDPGPGSRARRRLFLVLVAAGSAERSHQLGGRDFAPWVAGLGLLATSGMNGIVLIPVLAGALLVRESRVRAASPKARAVAVGVALLAALAVPLYFAAFHPTAT